MIEFQFLLFIILQVFAQVFSEILPELPPTFETPLILNGDLIQFPTFCTLVEPGNKNKPIPCRPALFGAKEYSKNEIQVTWYHNNGCSGEPNSNIDVSYTNKFVLISRGVCPFVNKAYNAQKNNASGVLIVDHPTKKEDQMNSLTGRDASAESALIKMWSEIKDKNISDQIYIPILSIRNEYSNTINNKYMKFHWTTKCRAQLAYISGKDRLRRFEGDWNATKETRAQAQTMFKLLGTASSILRQYKEGEEYFRKSISSYPTRSPKAVSVIHKLGILLVNHTNDNQTKWNEAYTLLPGSKAYLNNLAEVLISRVEGNRIPTWLLKNIANTTATTPKELLLMDGLIILSKAVKIRGTVYTPRVTMNQVIIMSKLNDIKEETFAHDFVRDKILDCSEDAAAYGDEQASITCIKLLHLHDEKFWFYTPLMQERKRILKEWWNWFVDCTLWPIRSLIKMFAGDSNGNESSKVNTAAKIQEMPSGKALEDYQGYRL
jgi:hypothetical protein